MINFTGDLSGQFLEIAKDAASIADLKKIISNIVIESADDSSFKKYLNLYYGPLVESGDSEKDNPDFLETNIFVNISIIGEIDLVFQDMEKVSIEHYNETISGIFSQAKKLEELFDMVEKFNTFVEVISKKITNTTRIGAPIKLEWLEKLKPLDVALSNLDPNYFFSYGGPNSLYYYLPRFDGYVTTENVFNEQVTHTVTGNMYPTHLYYKGLAEIRNSKPSVYVDLARGFSEKDVNSIIDTLHRESLNIIFNDTEPIQKSKSSRVYDFRSPNENLNVEKEIAVSALLKTGDSYGDSYATIRRLEDGDFLFSDYITKQNIKCKEVIEAYEYLYAIHSIKP